MRNHLHTYGYAHFCGWIRTAPASPCFSGKPSAQQRLRRRGEEWGSGRFIQGSRPPRPPQSTWPVSTQNPCLVNVVSALQSHLSLQRNFFFFFFDSTYFRLWIFYFALVDVKLSVQVLVVRSFTHLPGAFCLIPILNTIHFRGFFLSNIFTALFCLYWHEPTNQSAVVVAR